MRPLALAFALVAGTLPACSPPAPHPHLVFVVLDDVRSDRLSQCGYERPTSPTLSRLCAGATADCTCDAVAPSSWTMPSHASFFTGAEVAEHGAGMAGSDTDVRLGAGTHARPLGPELPTLAETLAARGYQTLALSGNPLVSPPSGLLRGFETFAHADEFGRLYGNKLVRRLRTVLADRDPERPLFLFVNIADAHRPWFAIPDGVGWVPPRSYLGFRQKPGQPNPLLRDFVTGTMAPEAAAELVAHLNDVYDWAVWRADETLAGVLEVLRQGGWIEGERAYRLVITSDHGEHLGEHGLMGHAAPYLYEEIARVPLAVLGTTAVEVPDQVAAVVSYDILLDGRPRRRPLLASAFASETWPLWYGPRFGTRPAAALWDGRRKTVHQDGRIERYDLGADPAEMSPSAWSGKAEVDVLERLIAALQAVGSGEPPDPEVLELLRSLGYA
jgi:arylsulfatase A-like enzyme